VQRYTKKTIQILFLFIYFLLFENQSVTSMLIQKNEVFQWFFGTEKRQIRKKVGKKKCRLKKCKNTFFTKILL